MVQGCLIALHRRNSQAEFLMKKKEELRYLMDRCLAGIDTPSIAPTEEPGPFGLVQGSSGAPEVRSCDSRNLLKKACLSDKTLDNFHVWSQGSLGLKVTSAHGAAPKFHTCGSSSGSSTNRDKRLANPTFWGYNGATRTNESPVKNRTLNNICLSRTNGGKAQADRWSQGCRNTSCFHALGSGTVDTHRGSLALAIGTKRSRWGRPNTLQITSNTLRRRDHSVGRTWSWRLSWSAKTFFFPRNISDRQGDWMTLGPENYLGSLATQDMRHYAALIPDKRQPWRCRSSGRHWPDNVGRNAARARETAIISSTLMCSELSSLDHTLEDVISNRWAPQPDRYASVSDNRDGGGTWRGSPNTHLSSWSHQRTASTHSCDRRIWMAGSSTMGDQWSLRCHCKGHICKQPRGRKHSREAMWPNTYCHTRAGGDGSRRKEVATSRKRARWVSDGNTFSRNVSISIPRYWTRVDGWRSDFSQLTIIPRSLHDWRTGSRCCSRRVLDSAMTSQLSM